MSAKYSKKSFLVIAITGLVISSQHLAFADDTSNWLQSLFGSNQNQSQSSNGQGQADQKQIQADQNFAQQYYQATTQDQETLRQAYQQLERDRRAGLNTSADIQAIRNQEKVVRTDLANQRNNAVDLSRDGVSSPYSVPANGQWGSQVDRRWDNRYYHNGYPQHAQRNYDDRWRYNRS